MKKMSVILMLVMACVLVLFSGAQVSAAETKSIVIRYGTDLPPHLAPALGQHWWADEVTKRTEGRVKVQISPASSLVNQAGAIEAVMSGVADMYMLSTASHRRTFRITSIQGLPGAGFPDDTLEANTAHVDAFFTLLKKFPAAAAEYKDFGDMFFYVIYSEAYIASKGKIVVPADLKGLKVGSNGIRMDLMRQLGAAPVEDVPPTAYEKLMIGVTDAAFVAISAWHDFKIHEVTKYVLDVPFGGGGHPIVVNKKTWEKISPQDQQIMKDLAPQAAKISHQAIADLNAKSWQEAIEKNMVVSPSPAEKQLWENDFKKIWDGWMAENVKAGTTNIQEIFDFWKKLADEAWAKNRK